MKRTMCIFLAVLVLAGCVLLTACEKPVEEPLQAKYLREIQDAYDGEMAKEENQTTSAMVQITQHYADLWKTAAEDCYEKIMAFGGKLTANDRFDSLDALRAHAAEAKKAFDAGYEAQCEAYFRSLQEAHGDGTIVGLSMAVYEYELQKQWALTLCDLYDTCCK